MISGGPRARSVACPCARTTIGACLRTPVPASKDAKLLLALPQTVLRPSLGGSPKPVLVEPYQGDAHFMRTGLHTEQKHRTAAVPLLPDVLKPERRHSRPARATVAAHGAPAVEKESTPTKQTDVGENRATAGIVAGEPQSTEVAIAREIAAALARGGDTALQVVPMPGDGGMQAITDVLTLPDADMAIVPVSLADRFRDATRSVDIRNK